MVWTAFMCGCDDPGRTFVIDTGDCVRHDCKLVSDAFDAYRDVLLKMVKGHDVPLYEMADMYKKILRVDVEARIKGYNIKQCSYNGKQERHIH